MEGNAREFYITGSERELCVLCCIVIPFILDVRLVDAPSRGHTVGMSHRVSPSDLPCAVLALFFIARRILPFLSLVNGEVEFCVCTHELIVHLLGMIYFVLFYFIFCEEKFQFM